MASILKIGGKYRVQIRKQGLPTVTKSFTALKSAQSFAKKIESEMERGLWTDSTSAESTTLSELVELYRKKTLPKFKGSYETGIRLNLLVRELGEQPLARLTPHIVNQFKNKRLKVVMSATVKRELGTLSALLSTGEKEYGIYLPQGNPVTKIKMPSEGAGRDRRPSSEELALLMDDQTIGQIVTFAVETGMRRGEIVGIQYGHVNWNNQTLLIPETKTGVARTIPLSGRAVTVLRARFEAGEGKAWAMEPHSVTRAFERACGRHGIENLRFHDLRHEATSRFFEKGLNLMEAASITGHQDLRMLKRYTHIRAETLVSRLG